MSRFDFISTPLAGLLLVQRKALEDNRGFLTRIYCADEFREAGVNKTIAQINHTLTRKKGTVRGLHFQHPPYAETKLVSCLKGQIWDIAIDVRKGSPTFLQWHGEILSAENRKSFLIPEGYAHGFQTLCDDCEIIYLHTEPYNSNAEAALNVHDPVLNISWIEPVSEFSERDQNHPFISNDFQGLVL